MTLVQQAVSADSLRQVLRRVYASSEYDWSQPTDPLRFFRDLFWDIVGWLRDLAVDHPVAYWAILGAMVVLLVSIVVHLSYVIWQVLRPRDDRVTAARTAPIALRDASWHLSQARQLADAGRYGEALTHRFTALLLELDRRHVIRFDSSKTPAEYVYEADLDDEARGTLRMLVSSFYRHVFGGAPCSAEELDAFHRTAGTIVRRRVTA